VKLDVLFLSSLDSDVESLRKGPSEKMLRFIEVSARRDHEEIKPII
jgi:hypothetical protein